MYACFAARTKSMIPHIIHQTYKTFASIPLCWAETPSRWQALHPTWTYTFWSDADLEALIAADFPWFLQRYRAFPHVIQRVDAARYFILFKFGGVYADLDVAPLVPLDPWVDAVSSEVALVASGHVSSCITNSFMASAPGASLWPLVHREMLCRGAPWWAVTRHFRVMTTTGPMMLDRVVRRDATATVSIFPPTLFATARPRVSENAVLQHLKGQSWCGADTYVFAFIWAHVGLFAGAGAVAAAAVVVALLVVLVRSAMMKSALRACQKASSSCFLRERQNSRAAEI
jgi:mannosyltransferase OCH1-like enzyme